MRRSPRRVLAFLLTLAAFTLAHRAIGQSLGSAFTYQGQIKKDGAAYTGTCDFTFSLWTTAGSGSPPVGGTQIGGNVVKSGVSVAAGIFTTSVDFGAGSFQGDTRWLQVAAVCPPGGAATPLAPRVAVSASPYALALPGLRTQTGGSSPNILGGHLDNTAGAAVGATIAGGGSNGVPNEVTDNHGTVGGGQGNEAGDGAGTASDAAYATVAGGRLNRAGGAYSTVGGGYGNLVDADYAVIAGGGRSDPANLATGNRVTNDYGAVGGGGNNQAGADDPQATVARYATVGGGRENKAVYPYTTVSGGLQNLASASYATVSGGWSNRATWDYSFVGGGANNLAATAYSTVAGGNGNHAELGLGTTVGGGEANVASGSHATVSGGDTNEAGGEYAVVPGGTGNQANGDYSFAAGRNARADHLGAFVWADSTNLPFSSTSADSFRVRATGGGVRMVVAVDGAGAITWSCVVSNGNSWSCSSDRNQKENLEEVDSLVVLERLARLPIYRWNGKGADPSVKHMGPTSQDFLASFGLGDDEKLISTIDLDGVALAAIQGLHRRLEESRAEVGQLRERLDALERAMSGGSATP